LKIGEILKSKIQIFVPVNIGRNLDSLLKRMAPDAEFITPSSSAEELKLFNEIFSAGNREEIPELIVTLHPEILKHLDEIENSGFYLPLPVQFPALRSELVQAGFDGASAFLKPLLITPLIMLVNSDLEQPPQSWANLLDRRFYGKVLAPEIDTPVSVVFQQIMKEISGDNTAPFLDKMVYSGLPFDVIMGVNKGFYDVGLLPLPFARYNVGKNLKMVWPQEGAIALPEMMFIRKDASEDTLKVAEYLLGKNIQRFFSQLGGLIPVLDGIPFPVEVKQNNNNLYWKGWDWYKKLSSDFSF